MLNSIKIDKVNKTLLGGLINLMGIKVAHAFYRYDHVFRKPVLSATMLLPGRGCSWSRERHGGCTMCGFKNALSSLGINKVFNDDEILRLFELGLSSLARERPKIMNIYNGGSFLNRDEISCRVQEEVVRKVKENSPAEMLFIESRPEFIDPVHLQGLVSCLKPKSLEIGIGLEAVTDNIRNLYINKGISRQGYERAIKVAKELGVRILTYILVKPLCLSEKEAIDEAVRTAKYAFDSGSYEVSFEASCIQKGTKMHELYKAGNYRPPWLWSILEIIKATHHLGNIRVGSFWDFPVPIVKSRNCGHCSGKIEKLLDRYRIDHDTSIFETVNCKCKKTWEGLLEEGK